GRLPRSAHHRRARAPPAREARAEPPRAGVHPHGARRRLPIPRLSSELFAIRPTLRGMPSTLRSGALLVGCGVVGAVAALAVAGAGGWLGGGTTIERVAAPPPDSGVTSPVSLPKTPAGGLDASDLYRRRSPGVVTIDVVFGDGSAFSGSGF